MQPNIRNILLLFLLPFMLNGQSLLTLKEAFQLALERNPDIVAARNNSHINQNNSHPGNAGLLPDIAVKASSFYSNGDTQTTSGYVQAQSTRNSLSIEASYTLFDGFANLNTYRKLQSVAHYSNFIARQTTERTLLIVAEAYYNVALKEEQVKIARQSLDISRDRWQRVRNRIQYGQSSTINLLNAEVDYNTDSINVLNAELNLDQTRREFNILFNRNPESTFRVEHRVLFLPLPPVDSLLQLAIENNSGYLAVQELTQQAGKDIKIAGSAFLPRLNAVASYSANNTENNFKIGLHDPYTDQTVSLNLSLNLFNGFRDKIRFQNAQIQKKTTQLREREFLNQLQSDIQNAYQSNVNNRLVLETSRKSVETAKLNFRRSKELFELGQITSTRFREAQLNLNNAQIQLFQATYNTKLAELRVLQLAGILLQSI